MTGGFSCILPRHKDQRRFFGSRAAIIGGFTLYLNEN
jgi:hypothetical protein